MCIVGGYGKCEVRDCSSSRGNYSLHRYAPTILRGLRFLVNLTLHDDILYRKSVLVIERNIREHRLPFTMPSLLNYRYFADRAVRRFASIDRRPRSSKSLGLQSVQLICTFFVPSGRTWVRTPYLRGCFIPHQFVKPTGIGRRRRNVGRWRRRFRIRLFETFLQIALRQLDPTRSRFVVLG